MLKKGVILQKRSGTLNLLVAKINLIKEVKISVLSNLESLL